MQRQRLHIEEIHDDEDGEQDQLAPLCRVAEEELDVLQDELSLGHRQPAEQRAHRPTPQATANESLRAFLRLGEPLGIQRAVQHGAERDEGGGGGPEQDERQRIQLVPQESHDGLRRPFARQKWRGRAAQQDDEVQQIAKSFGAGQLLRPDYAEQQDHAAGGTERDDRQQVARATRGENIDEHQRHCAAEYRRQNQHRHDRDDRVQRKQHSSLVDDAIGCEDRHRHQRHHPGRVQQRLAQLCEIEPQPVDRRRNEEVEIPREEETRQRRDHVREHQDRDERQQDEPEDFSGDQGPELLDAAQSLQDPVENPKYTGPERAADQRQNDELAGAAFGTLLAQPLQRGAPLRLQDVRERRLLHRPSTSASSRICAPPVSLRKSSSRLASPA